MHFNNLLQRKKLGKNIDPIILKARKRLDVGLLDRRHLTFKNSGLPKSSITKILRKFLKRNSRVLLSADCDFYPYGKSLAPLIKSIKILPNEKGWFQRQLRGQSDFMKADIKRILKMIKACKRLKYLDILKIPDLKSSFIKPLRSLKALECLVVEWKVELSGIGPRFCTFLPQLRRLHLKLYPFEKIKKEEFDETSDEDDEESRYISRQYTKTKDLVPGLSKFSSEMLSYLKNLKHLELDYVTITVPKGQCGIEMLLNSIDPERVQKFCFAFHVKTFTLNVEKVLPLLQKVEHLELFKDRNSNQKTSFDASRTLLFFILKNHKINEIEIIKNCSSLPKNSLLKMKTRISPKRRNFY